MTRLRSLRIAARAAMITMLVASAVGPARAQTSEDALRFAGRMPYASPVSLGTGGAGTAGLGAYSDLFQNPAGLALMRQSAFSLGLSSEVASDESVFSVGNDRGLSSADASATRLAHLAYAYRFPTRQGSLVFAAGISQVGTFNRELSYEGDNGLNSLTDYLMPLPGEFEFFEDDQGLYPEFYRTLSFVGYETYAIDFDQDAYDRGDAVPFLPAVSAGTILQQGTVIEEGATHEVSVGAALEAARGFYVGASIGIPFGTYDYRRVHEEDDIRNENDGFGGTTDFDYLRYFDSYSSDMVGVNVRLGLSAVVSPQLRVGASVETPTVYSIDESYDLQLLTSFDNGDVFEYGDDLSEDAGRGEFRYDLRTPWRLGLGAAFTSGALSVFADAMLVDWSRLEFDSDDYAFVQENLAIREGLESTVATRFGLAYDMGDFTLRGGLGFDPDPRKSSLVDEVDRSRMHVSAGLSYQVDRQFAVDFGWLQQRFDDAFSPYVEVENAPVVSEEMVRNHFQVAVRMAF